MLMQLGQMVCMLVLALFTGWWVFDWLETKVPEDAGFPSAESAGYMDDPPPYEYKPWHKYTGWIAAAITVAMLALISAHLWG